MKKNLSWKISRDCPFKSISQIGTENKTKNRRTRCSHRMTKEECQDRRTGQPGQDSQDRAGHPGQDSYDRTAKDDLDMRPNRDRPNRKSRQDIQDKTARTGLPRLDCSDKTAKTGLPDRGQLGQDSQNRIA